MRVLDLRSTALDDQREIFDGLLPGVGAGQYEINPAGVRIRTGLSRDIFDRVDRTSET
jgi:hypothetical protein